MQRFTGFKDICTEISKVFDSMFVSEIPTKHHLPALVHKLAEEPDIPPVLGFCSREVLLSRPNHLQAADHNQEITHHTLKKATYDQASQQCHHKHMATCQKGFHGQTGCRLSMKCGKCFQTGCVLLEELTQDEAVDMATNKQDFDSIPEDAFLQKEEDDNILDEILEQHNDAEEWSVIDADDVLDISDDDANNEHCNEYLCEQDGKKIGIGFCVIKNIPENLPLQHTLCFLFLKRHLVHHYLFGKHQEQLQTKSFQNQTMIPPPSHVMTSCTA